MGVVRELEGAGHAPPGAQIAVVSDIPPGGGLSSSAALSVAAAAALGRLAGADLSPELVSEAAYGGEHDYVGVRCGRMDQTVVAHAVEGTAMYFDTATGARGFAPFPLKVWIVPTGVEHTLAAGGYNARRAECEAALATCRARWPELTALAQLGSARLDEAMALLPAPLNRRVRHVVTETARTLAVRHALELGDLALVGRLLVEGHESLRTDYECSVPEADLLVDAGVRAGALGARLTGAGWGGSVVMLVPEDREALALEATAAAFAAGFGRRPAPWPAHASAGVRLEPVG
jgi:galactokinase